MVYEYPDDPVRSVPPGWYEEEQWIERKDKREGQAEQEQRINDYQGVIMKNMLAARSVLAVKVGACLAILVGAATLATWCSIVVPDYRLRDATNTISSISKTPGKIDIRTIGEALVKSAHRLS